MKTLRALPTLLALLALQFLAPIVAAAPLQVTIAFSSPVVFPGQVTNLQVTVANANPAPLDVSFTVSYPTGLVNATFQGVTAGSTNGGPCSTNTDVGFAVGGGSVFWHSANIGGDGLDCRFEVSVKAPAAGSYTVSLAPDAVANPPGFGSNASSATLTVLPLPPVVQTVTSTAATGPGTLSAILAALNASCPAAPTRIEFAIPAATDPGCDASSGICVVQLDFSTGRAISCPDVLVDGYTQPGASPNTATGTTNDAQLRIEFAGTDGFTINHDNVTMRGIAFAGVPVEVNQRQVEGIGLVGVGNPVLTGNSFGWHADGLTPVGGANTARISINNGQATLVTGARVGGATPAERNLVTQVGAGDGIALSGASGAIVEGNLFNLDRNGNAVAGAATTNAVRSDAAGNTGNLIRRNVITRTSESGFTCSAGNGTTLSENALFAVNLSAQAHPRGIRLQPGCNRDQPAPVLSSVTVGAQVVVQGTLASAHGETFRIEFFHNTLPDTGNLGLGEQFVGALDVVTDASGTAAFTASLPSFARNVTATATRLVTGDTSAFSAPVPAGSGPPTFASPLVELDATFGTPFTYTFTASGQAPFSWTLVQPCVLPAGFTFDAATGTLSGTANGTAARHRCSVRASNGLPPDAVQEFELRTNAVAGMPAFTTDFLLPGATVGVPYLATVGTTGTPSITVGEIAGIVPPGLSVGTGGQVVGTPTTAGTFDFVLRAVGSGLAYQPFRIVVAPPGPLTITSAAPAAATEFVNYAHTFTATGQGPITWSVITGTLPAGLTLASDGVLGGLASDSGTFNFTVQASNGVATATQDVALVVTFNSRIISVSKSGNGSGTITSTPARLACGAECSKHFAINSTAALTATADADSVFDGWGGACTGTTPFCNLSMTTNRVVAASFVKKQFALSVTVQGPGSITSSPAGVNCVSSCSPSFEIGTVLTLTATPSANAVFTGWSGACTGTGDCVVTMDAAKSVTASFVARRTLTVARAGTGTGSVASSPAGIACGATCSATYDQGATVTLTATPQAGSTFKGWSGDCTGTAACIVSMTAAKNVTATFDAVAATQPLTVSATFGPRLPILVPLPGIGTVSCLTTCTYDAPTGSVITLSSGPSDYFVFKAWSGDCTGSQATCTVTMDGPRNVTATIDPRQYNVTFTFAGTGTGSVSVNGVTCISTCTVSVPAPTVVVSEFAASDSRFDGWSGACTGSSCTLDLKQDLAVVATFTKMVIVGVNVVGPGSVVSSPPGISCTGFPGATSHCSARFPKGFSVTLNSLPASQAGTWTGCASTGPATCTVDTSADRNITARFIEPSRDVAIDVPAGAAQVSVRNMAGIEVLRCTAPGTTCFGRFLVGDTLTAEVTTAPGFVHAGWLARTEGAFLGLAPGTCGSTTPICEMPLTGGGLGALPATVAFRLHPYVFASPATLSGVATATATATARGTRVGTAFSPPPAILVRDANGAPVAEAPVTFTVVPGPSGASGSTSPADASARAYAARTGPDGIASLAMFANGIVGAWTLRVSVAQGSAAPIDIAMANTNDPVPVALPGTGLATIPVSSAVGIPLSVKVTATNGLPVAGATVRFIAPTSPNAQGAPVPSGMLTPATTTTNARGIASTTLRSNGVLGTFAISVRVTLPRLGASNAGFEGDDYVTELVVQASDDPAIQSLDPAADSDGDGIPNGVELAEGTLPFDKDNDVFADGRLFAMQQYRDFLSREGDASGIDFWSSQVEAGALSRGQVIRAFFDSPEFQGAVAPVARLYFAYFLRIPDQAGLEFWASQYRNGATLDSIASFFATSPEFAARYGALDNGAFVDLVYRNVLGRAPDAPGRAFWKDQLDSGAMTRGGVMLGFSESAEYRDLISAEVFVTMTYLGMLDRAPDAQGFAFWVDAFDRGTSSLALVDLFLASPEYRSRFLP